VSASDDHTIRVWDADTGLELRSMLAHSGYVRCIALSPDGAELVSGAYIMLFWGGCCTSLLYLAGCDDGTLCVHEIDSGREIARERRAHRRTVYTVAYAGPVIVSSASNESVCVWDARLTALAEPLLAHNCDIISATVLPSGKRIVAAASGA